MIYSLIRFIKRLEKILFEYHFLKFPFCFIIIIILSRQKRATNLSVQRVQQGVKFYLPFDTSYRPFNKTYRDQVHL